MSALCGSAHDVEQSPVHLEHGVLHGLRVDLVCKLGEVCRDAVQGSAAETVNVLRDEREG